MLGNSLAVNVAVEKATIIAVVYNIPGLFLRPLRFSAVGGCIAFYFLQSAFDNPTVDTHYVGYLRNSLFQLMKLADGFGKNVTNVAVLDNVDLVNYNGQCKSDGMDTTKRLALRTACIIKNLFEMTPYYWRTSQDDAKKLETIDRLTTEIDILFSVYKKN